MSNEVEIVVTGDNRAKPALDAARKDVKGLGDDAKTSSKGVDALGAGLKDVGEKAAASLSRSTAGFKNLDAEINKTKTTLGDLKAKFASTGEMGLLGDIDKEGAKLKKLEGQAKRLFETVDRSSSDSSKKMGLLGFALDEFVPKIAKAAGGAIINGVESGVQSAGKAASSNPWISLGIAAGITLGLPVIGAAITGAVGGGVIAGGLLLASKDPRVGSAWTAVADTAKGKLTSAADVFVDPLLHGAHTFESTLGRILPNIQHDFDRLAPTADRLFSGAAGFVERMMPGIDALSSAAGPVLNDLANELPKLGAAVSQAFKDIAGGGAGGAQAMRDMLTSVEITIVSVGKLIGWLEKWYLIERSIASAVTGDWDGAVQRMAQVGHSAEETTRVGGLMVSTFQNVAAAVGSTGPAAELTGGQLKSLSDQINAVTLTADILKGQMVDKVMGAMLGASHATLGVAESLTSLDSTFKGIGPAIDSSTGQIAMNTQAGQRQREAVLSAIEANLRQYDVMIQSGSSAEDAAKKYDVNTKALHDQLRQAGLTEQQVHDLIGEYGNVPNKVNTTVATQGLTTAIENLDDLIRKLNGMPTRRDIYITQHLSSVGSFYQSPDRLFDTPGHAHGGIIGAAGGGPRSNLTWVGEQGRELVRLPYGSTVIPHGQSERMADSNSDGGGSAGGYASADAIGEAVARRVVPALKELAELANRPAVLQADGVELARTVRQGNRSLERQG